MLPSSSERMSLLVRTPTTRMWFPLYWLTSQARSVRGFLSRRAMHASCDSPSHVSAKHRVLAACFCLTAPFRARFSPREMARAAHVQRLRGCLYILWYCYIPPCRFSRHSSSWNQCSFVLHAPRILTLSLSQQFPESDKTQSSPGYPD